MVVFKHYSDSGQSYLCILDHEHQRSEEGTTLFVGTPLLRGYGPTWPPLVNAFRLKEWSHAHIDTSKKKDNKYILDSPHHKPSTNVAPLLTLGKRTQNDVVEWGDCVLFPGEFGYVRGYWEWTEDILSRCERILKKAYIYGSVKTSLFTYDRNLDIVKCFCESWCSQTNTLLISFGELSISLWDLFECSGLPILGQLFDEVVPSHEELTGKDANGHSFLPPTCKYLFHAYHCIAGKEASVSIRDWIGFWSKKKIFYSRPPPRKESSSRVRPHKTHNPLDNHGKHQRWSRDEEAVFSKLNIPSELKEETFLAAFLACWLCSFVLPIKEVNFIRPGVFKMACLMASGQRVSLAIPVLAAIYRGLNDISAHPDPSHSNIFVPFHFVYVWLAQYFKTHFPAPSGLRGPPMVTFSGEGGSKHYRPADARKKIQKGDGICWTVNMNMKSTNLLLEDGVDSLYREQSYFISLRSCYLTLRHGEEFIIEPYNPHRFSRQFGYFQDDPGVHRFDTRRGNLEEGLRFWRTSTLIKTLSVVHLPAVPLIPSSFSTSRYKKWWADVHGQYVKDDIKPIDSSKPNKVIDQKPNVTAPGDIGVVMQSVAQPNQESRLVAHNDGDDDEVTQSMSPKARISMFPNPKGNKRPLESLDDQDDSSNGSRDRNWKRFKEFSNSHYEVNAPNRNSSASLPSAPNLDEKFDESLGMEDNQGQTHSSHQPNIVDIENSYESGTTPQHNVITKSALPAASEFVGKKVILESRIMFLNISWGKIQEKIGRTSLNELSSLRGATFEILETMKEIAKDVDISLLESRLREFFEKTESYDEARSVSASRQSQKLIAQQLKNMGGNLELTRAKVASEVMQIESEVKSLKRLKKRVKKLEASLEARKTSRLSFEAEVVKLEGEIATLKSMSSPTVEEIANLESLKSYLEASYEELKNLKPFA